MVQSADHPKLPARPRKSSVFARLFGSGFAGLGWTEGTATRRAGWRPPENDAGNRRSEPYPQPTPNPSDPAGGFPDNALRAPVRSRRTTRLKRRVRPTRRFWSISASGEAR